MEANEAATRVMNAPRIAAGQRLGDTLLLMGLTDEAEQTKTFLIENLSFDKDITVKNFRSRSASSADCSPATR